MSASSSRLPLEEEVQQVFEEIARGAGQRGASSELLLQCDLADFGRADG